MAVPVMSLTSQHADELLPADYRHIDVTLLATENDTWRIVADDDTYYVKIHTKPWYGGKPDGTVVRHEATAHRKLRHHGLPTADVVAVSYDSDNPLGWPFMLTRALHGTSLVELLPRMDRDEADEALRAVGAYLGRMHAITFDHPGYLVDGPPTAPPDPSRWQHGIWRYERSLGDAIASWALLKDELDLPTMDSVAGLLAEKVDDLRASYRPPRFVHGDCHANQFFLSADGGGWAVTGVLDLEVASAGSPLFDFLAFVIEMAGRFRATPLPWWDPFLDGYGAQVDLDLVRLGLTAAGHINFTCLGPHAWPGTRAEIVRHVMRARNWRDLADLSRIAAK